MAGFDTVIHVAQTLTLGCTSVEYFRAGTAYQSVMVGAYKLERGRAAANFCTGQHKRDVLPAGMLAAEFEAVCGSHCQAGFRTMGAGVDTSLRGFVHMMHSKISFGGIR